MLFKPLYTHNENSKVNWKTLSINPNAIYILENNLDKVNWDNLSLNPNAMHLLFKYDYQTME